MKGKYADVIALRRNPLDDIAQLKDGVFFVMKAGRVYRNERMNLI